MTGIRLLGLLATGLFFVAGLLLPPSQWGWNQAVAVEKQDDAGTKNDAASPSGTSVIEPVRQQPVTEYNKTKAQIYKQACEQPKDSNDAQLCEQWRAAVAAEAQVSLNWWGTWLLFGTLIFTGFAAIAAWLTFRVMKRTGERQLRAYLSVVRAELRNVDGGVMEADVVIKNSGQTPAYEVVTWGGMYIRAYPLVHPIPDPERDTPRSSIVGPGTEFGKIEKAVNSDGSSPITDAHRQAILNGDLSVYVTGEIIYRDAFGKKWVQTYRFFTGGGHPFPFVKRKGKTVGRLTPHEDGNQERQG
jgi:hypothetical protein